MKHKNTSLGFTIVELLVVILVIGILAGLVYTGYGQYQRKAKNSLKNDAAKSLTVGLKTYIGKYNQYPLPDSAVSIIYGVCLGKGPELRDGKCTNASWSEVSSNFNVELEKVTKLSNFEYDTSRIQLSGGEFYEGIVFVQRGGAKVNSKNNKFFLEYALAGDDATCGKQGAVKRNNPNSYESTTLDYSLRANGNTLCVIPLLDPDNPESVLP